MSWSFATAWALAKLAGVAFLVIALATPAFRLWAEHRADRRWRAQA